ncbi:hypothetical protein KY290_021390 [Solanum tuberosum]|uniref:Uncharacterized protein n=1 Tax=Solanum tuberosum TaxID=4113 RepID=A0ABQ7V3F7_SOLTU|nr:hypothetical protein KY284_020277 [Solanum tuberosum]KAH0682802.1 hypothetical protein KY289_020554 [Solanum tuberosum]KAH0693221.1 hypothetical protein KY285_020318 [Solanum tuberosum]KAH0757897.1 hypothetical protein KY290_021390 [Solanum tuberosum]
MSNYWCMKWIGRQMEDERIEVVAICSRRGGDEDGVEQRRRRWEVALGKGQEEDGAALVVSPELGG